MAKTKPTTTATRTDKPVGVYLRVSSDDQTHDSQRSEVDAWLAREGIDPAKVEWYADTESGRKASRPDYDRLERDIAAGLRRTIVVWKLDRMARDMFEGLDTLHRWLKSKLRVVSVTQNFDLSGTTGKIVAAVLFGVAELDWSDRRERQAAGIKRVKADPKLRAEKYAGRVKGTTKGKPERAAELKARGLAAPEIATALGVSLRTVFRYLGTAGKTE